MKCAKTYNKKSIKIKNWENKVPHERPICPHWDHKWSNWAPRRPDSVSWVLSWHDWERYRRRWFSSSSWWSATGASGSCTRRRECECRLCARCRSRDVAPFSAAWSLCTRLACSEVRISISGSANVGSRMFSYMIWV